MANLLELIGLKQDAEAEKVKTYLDRLKPAAYTSPSGVRVALRYSQAVEKSVSHKLDGYTYNGIKGTLLQDLGVAGGVYPLVCYVAGNDYDIEAAKLDAALEETGVGTLEHPVYGRKRVVVSTVKRQDDPINGGGIGAFSIEFRETIEFTPRGVENPATVSEELLSDANAAGAIDFSNVALSVINDVITFKEDVLSTLNTVSNALTDIIAASSDAIVVFNNIKRDIQSNIDTIINFPENLAAQYQIMIQLTTTSGANTTDALVALSALSADTSNFTITAGSTAEINRSILAELIVGATINSASILIQNETYPTKPATFDAIATLDTFLLGSTQALDEKQAGFEGNIFEKQYFSTIDAFKAIAALATNVKADLQLRAFDAKLERSLVTARSYSILELASALYGNLDDETIDFLVDTNVLIDDELLVVPAERHIVYYV